MGYPHSWMGYKGKSYLEMDDEWGYPHFRKPPHLWCRRCLRQNVRDNLGTLFIVEGAADAHATLCWDEWAKDCRWKIAKMVEIRWNKCRVQKCSKGCFHRPSSLDLQKGVCHAAADNHHVDLQPLYHATYGDIKTWCPLEQQVLHNKEMEKKDHMYSMYLQTQRIGCQNTLCVSVPFVLSTCSREEINKAAFGLVEHVHDQLDFVADLYFRLS